MVLERRAGANQRARVLLPWDRRAGRGELVPRFKSPDDAWFGNGRTGGNRRHARARVPEMAREHDQLLRDARDPAGPSGTGCTLLRVAVRRHSVAWRRPWPAAALGAPKGWLARDPDRGESD